MESFMSNVGSFILKEYKSQNHLSVDHGTDFVTINYFDGTKINTDSWSTEIELTPELAIEIGNQLIVRAREILSYKDNVFKVCKKCGIIYNSTKQDSCPKHSNKDK
jgi:hypothetical protein